MRVADVLTWGVVSVRPEDTIEQAVALMLGERISGLPVIAENGDLAGILTEGDLLRRVELGTERQRPRWMEFFVNSGQLADEYTQSRGRKVAELMTRDVAVVNTTQPLAEAVELMLARKLKRLPVMDGKRVVGILSRADVLRILNRMMAQAAAPVRRDDVELTSAVEAEFAKLPFGTAGIAASVTEGVARLTGAILDERQRNAVRVAAENVPGVRGVTDEMAWIPPIGTGF